VLFRNFGVLHVRFDFCGMTQHIRDHGVDVIQAKCGVSLDDFLRTRALIPRANQGFQGHTRLPNADGVIGIFAEWHSGRWLERERHDLM
jgi:hypothetical protein